MPSFYSIADLRAEFDAEYDRDVLSWGGFQSLDGMCEIFRRFEAVLFEASPLDETHKNVALSFCDHALAALELVRARHAHLLIHPIFEMIVRCRSRLTSSDLPQERLLS